MERSQRVSPLTFGIAGQDPAASAFTSALANANNTSLSNAQDMYAELTGNPYVEEWNLGIQREIGRSSAIEIRYAGNMAMHAWLSYDLNE